MGCQDKENRRLVATGAILLLLMTSVADSKRLTKQVTLGPAEAALTDSDADLKSSETGHHGGHHDSKYYMYAQVPDYNKYEFGYKRGNEYHFREHHEKAHPHSGHFKTKVRWGDKHGGYGEHYWDYNHGDHHDDGYGHEQDLGHGHGHEGYHSQPVPAYEKSPSKKGGGGSSVVHVKEPRLLLDEDSA